VVEVVRPQILPAITFPSNMNKRKVKLKNITERYDFIEISPL
jgi:hypothetical protein